MSLAKPAAAQQSVHPTSGSLRDLQVFFWLWFFSTSQTLFTPAHLRVTPAVSQPRAKPNTSLIRKFRFWLKYFFFGVIIFNS